MKWFRLIVLGVVLAGLVIGGVENISARPTAAGESEFLVKFVRQVPRAVVEQFAARHGGSRRTEVARLGVQVLRFPAGVDQSAVLARMRAEAAVQYAEVNGVATASVVPNDAGYPNQWGLATIRAHQGWEIESGDPNVVIAIVDTGVDANHPDLQGQSVPGWNYDTFSPGYNTAETADNNGHGTHVAGIAAAVTNNNLGVAGTCPNCAFMPVKVLGSNGSGTYDAVASGIIYAADNGARVINLSLGGTTFSQTLQDAVDYAHNRGALVIAAAGNDGTDVTTYPAAFTNVMAVAATDSADRRASFSNYNSYISVAAPGTDIYSTYWSGSAGSGYAYKSGTSMATPYVAGLAGLLVSQEPARTSTTVRAVIENATDDVDSPGWDANTGHGRINVARALSGSISGQVVDATTGVALGNAQVEALQGGQVVATVQTAADGAYLLPYLPAGTYTTRVALSGYSTQTRTDVVVASGQTTVVDVTMTRVGAIAGKVLSGRKAVAGASVDVLQGTTTVGQATTDSYGNYQIANVPAGTYDVRAAATGYQTQIKAGVVVEPGQTTTGVNFSLARAK